MIPPRRLRRPRDLCIPRESGDDPDPPEVDQAIVGIPRESGDDPSPPKTYFARSMYSPRERG